MALLSFAVGLEASYLLLTMGAMVLVSIAVYSFCRNFLANEHAIWAGLLSQIFLSLYLAAYTWGQLPTLFAISSSLFMGAYLWHYLEDGRLKYLVISALLMGITAAVHHFTFICFTPFLVVATSLTLLLMKGIKVNVVLRRLAASSGIGLGIALVAIFPLWRFLWESNIQETIPHMSRANLFTNWDAFYKFFLMQYLPFLPAIPLTVIAVYRNRSLGTLFAVALLMFILGLGGSTPIPSLIFGSWWQWLTYDRFALWAGICLLPFLALLLPLRWLKVVKIPRGPTTFLLIALIVTGTAINVSYSNYEPLRYPYHAEKVQIEPILEFLEEDEAQQYRYITLGFGEAQMVELSTFTSARTLDGTYYTARQIPILKESGIATIDASKHNDNGLAVLSRILENASSYNLKFVFVNDAYYDDVLTRYDYEMKQFDSEDSTLGGVTVWEKENILPIEGDDRTEIGFWSYVWGILPLLLVIFLILSLVMCARRKNREAYD
jgi:MFS family permease